MSKRNTKNSRRMPTVFDNMRPNLRKKMEVKLWKEQTRDDKEKARIFEEGDEVWVKKENTTGWLAGVIKYKNGQYSYEVLCGGIIKRKHSDQLRKRLGAVDENPMASEINADTV